MRHALYTPRLPDIPHRCNDRRVVLTVGAIGRRPQTLENRNWKSRPSLCFHFEGNEELASDAFSNRSSHYVKSPVLLFPANQLLQSVFVDTCHDSKSRDVLYRKLRDGCVSRIILRSERVRSSSTSDREWHFIDWNMPNRTAPTPFIFEVQTRAVIYENFTPGTHRNCVLLFL